MMNPYLNNGNLGTIPKERLPHFNQPKPTKPPAKKNATEGLEKEILDHFNRLNISPQTARKKNREKMVAMVEDCLEEQLTQKTKKKFARETKKIFGSRQSQVLIDFIKQKQKK